jgi:ketopantoate reductase
MRTRLPGHAIAAAIIDAMQIATTTRPEANDPEATMCIAGAAVIGAHKTSMLQDVPNGRPLGVEALVGSVVELAQIVGVAVPAIATIYRAVKLLARTPIGVRVASLDAAPR